MLIKVKESVGLMATQLLDNVSLPIRLFLFLCLNFFPIAYVFYHMPTPAAQLLFLPAAEPWFNVRMLPTLIAYLSGCTLFGFAMLLAIKGVKKGSARESFLVSRYFFLFFLFNFLITAPVFLIKHPFALLPNILIIIIYTFFPSLLNRYNFYFSSLRWNTLLNIVLYILSLSFLVLLYYNITFIPEVVLNPYYRIPELYIGDKNTYQLINTTEFINANNLRGTHDKYDIQTPNWKSNKNCFLVEPNNQKMHQLAKSYAIDMSFQTGDMVTGKAFTKQYSPILVYRDDALCLFPAESPLLSGSPQSENLQKELALLQLEYSHNSWTPERVNDILHEQPDVIAQAKAKNAAFIENIAFSDTFQILFRGNLKHHQHIYLPSHEFLLGKPLNQISHQYGLGQTLLFAALCKVFSPDGLADYGLYLHSYPWLLYLVFTFFFIAMVAIFKKPQFVIVPILLYLLGKTIIGFEPMFDSGGFGEGRILLYPCIYYLVYKYYLSLQTKYAIVSLLALLISLFLNFEFGLFIALAFFITHAIFLFSRKSKNIWMLGGIFAIIIASKIFLSLGQRTVASTFLSGLLSLPIPSNILSWNLIFFIFCILFFLHMLHYKSKYTFLFLFSLCIRQFILVYFFWSGMSSHLYLYMPYTFLPFCIYGLFLFEEVAQTHSLPALCAPFKNVIISILCLTISVIIIFLIKDDYKNYRSLQRSYEKSVASLQTFEWTMPGTHFKSTMDPAYFVDSVDLIQQYTDKHENAIYIISQYDSFLTLLARKYSALPHFDMVPYLMSPAQVEETLAVFTQDQPEFIFVDKDIDVPYEFDLVPYEFSPGLNVESRMRILQLNELRNIFNQLRHAYIPVASSQLLTVYKRKR